MIEMEKARPVRSSLGPTGFPLANLLFPFLTVGLRWANLGESMKAVVYLIGIVLIALLLDGPLSATVLIFEKTNGINLGAIFPQGYGDRVASVSQEGFAYGLTGGATPNVVVDYARWAGWPSGYGDLRNVAYPTAFGTGEIRFVADPGFEVRLNGFDLGAWFNTNYVIRSLEILDVSGSPLYAQTNLLVIGTGNTHSTITFLQPIQARVLSIRIDSTNLGILSDRVCIDNIQFSQVAVPVYVDIALYPGLSVYGTVGKTYRVDYVDRLQPADWAPLATLVLTNNPTRFIDYDARSTSARYYRAVELP
jgi:hypothetical protein